MFFFITCLRALAACLITNTHYGSVYPSSSMAVGGLLGDVIFFAVSGFCLFNVKFNFFKWYGKRLYRIYPSVIIITVIYFCFGFYTFCEGKSFFWWFVYPTNFHFIASIIFLYIPFYIVSKIKFTRNHLWLVMGCVAVIYLIIYIFFYDKSFYRVDFVDEPMIRFIFFESMLLGAWFRNNIGKFQNKFSWLSVAMLIVSSIAYFGTKIFFSKFGLLLAFQCLNQLTLFVLLFSLLWLFTGIDQLLEKLPKTIKKVIDFISKLTLEIYLVQSVLIRLISPIGFPWNFIAVTASIIIAAYLLHLICKGFYFLCDKSVKLLKNKWRKE